MDSPITLISWSELPTIDLYKDQVVALVEEQISPFAVNEEDNLITASMVNNYVKAKLLPPPVKKRYKRVHLSRLIMATILKQTLTIAEVERLLVSVDALMPDDPQRMYESFRELLAVAQDPASAPDAALTEDQRAAVLYALISCVTRAKSRRLIAALHAETD